MKNKTIVIVTGIIVCVGIYANSLLHVSGERKHPINMGSFVSTGQYKINPEVLSKLPNRVDSKIFEELTEVSLDPVSTAPVGWKQADYIKIATALFQFVWIDDINEWTLYYMEFRANCQNDSGGLDAGEFYYYKDIQINGRRQYSVRGVSIDPQYNSVLWGGDTYFPRPLLNKWKAINLDKLIITAEEALRKSKEVKKKTVEIDGKNNCYIYVYMYPEVRGYDWRVNYPGNEDVFISSK